MRVDMSRAQTTTGVVLAGLLLLAGSVARAQYVWHNHVAANAINQIVQQDGKLYIATLGGLLVYDPARAEFQQLDTTRGLPSNALTCLTFASSDILYVGTSDIGVAKVQLTGGGLKLLRSLNEQIDGLSSNTITSVAMWGGDVVYGATPGAGTIRNDFASARYFARDGLPSDNVTDVLPQGDAVVIATDAGLAVLNRFGLIRRPAGGPPDAAVLGSDGLRLWAGTNSGAWVLNPSDSSWTNVGPASRDLQSLYWDGGTMWAGGGRYFHRYAGTGNTWTTFNADTVLSRFVLTGGNGALRTNGLTVTGSGDVYFGGVVTLERRGPGMIRYSPGGEMRSIFSNTPAANDVIRMSQDTDGSLWASFRSFYVGKLTQSGLWVNYNPSIPGAKLPSNQYANLTTLADSQGFKWFCTLSAPTSPVPLDRLDDKLDNDYSNDVWVRNGILSGGGDGLGSLNLQRATEDPAGNRWFMSDSFYSASGWWGIQILSRDGGEWLQMNPSREPRMLSGNVIDVEFGPSHTVYVGLRALGVQVWNPGGFDWSDLTNTSNHLWSTPVSRGNGLPAEAEVFALAVRSDRVLWVGASTGLYRYESGRTTKIPTYTGTSPGILNDQVRDLVLDGDENLWVATDFGLNRIARDDIADIQAFTTTAGFIALSGLRYPLDIISPLANAQCQVLAMDRKRNQLYVGTLGGLSVVSLSAPASGASDLSRVYVYPNPVYGRRGHDSLKIENISGPVTVEIYTVEGELVHSQAVSGPGEVIWDLTTKTGRIVGSGNYLVRVVDNGASVVKTVSVLR